MQESLYPQASAQHDLFALRDFNSTLNVTIIGSSDFATSMESAKQKRLYLCMAEYLKLVTISRPRNFKLKKRTKYR